MLGSSGWWNWSITWGSGGPSRRGERHEGAAESFWSRDHQHLPSKNAALELRERRLGQARARSTPVASSPKPGESGFSFIAVSSTRKIRSD